MASAAVLKSVRSHPKLLSLQHVDDAFLSCRGDAPMTPLGTDAPLFTASVSPRDPATKLAAVASTSVSKSQSSSVVNSFSSHRLCIPSSASSDDASDDEEDDSEDAPRGGAGKSLKGNTGRWTESEHKLFLQGLETFPYRAWKKIATLIKTRTVVQIRTHAQKYYQKLEKEEARLKERVAQDRAAVVAGAAPSIPASPASQKKKLHLMRKRKYSLLEMDMDLDDSCVLPSVPKRLAREQQLAAHMSPKQKTSSLSGSKVFFGNSMDTRFVFARGMKNYATMQPPHHLPMDFADAAAEAMILDFAEDKTLADNPVDCVDLTLASIDNDDLLQLTEEELEWFSTSSTVHGASGNPTMPDTLETVDTEPFLELDTANLDGESFAADLCLDDSDDDFVLDPEKFLTSYFAPIEKS